MRNINCQGFAEQVQMKEHTQWTVMTETKSRLIDTQIYLTVHDGSGDAAGRGSGDGWMCHSTLPSAKRANTTYLTQSWSAILPGLALPKCPQANCRFFFMQDLSSF